MSGNQYVYSIEVTQGGQHFLDLVAKNRKAIRARVARLITKYEKTHQAVSERHVRDLSLLVFTHGGRQAVCDEVRLNPRPRGPNFPLEGMRTVEIRVKAWIIKAAKPEGPVRGTLKERMGERYPSYPADGRVT